MRVNLIAVQVAMTRADYLGAHAFAAKIRSLMSQAMERAESGNPTLVAFPEDIGEPLTWLPYYRDEIGDATKLSEAMTRIVAEHSEPLDAPRGSDRIAALRKRLYVENAVAAERVYAETFSAIAREHHAYVSAGTINLPPMDESLHRGGRLIRDASRVHKQSYLFSPSGRCLRRVPKSTLPPGEDRLLDEGSELEHFPVRTAIGSLGTLACYDGVHEAMIERYDAAGATILLHPSHHATMRAGRSPASHQPGQARTWDAGTMIQGRENLQYTVAAFLVAGAFEEYRGEGQSFIARNTGNVDASWDDCVVAVSDTLDAAEVVAATVEVQM